MMTTSATASSAVTGGSERPKNLKQAAEAFESMFVAQLLKMAREAGTSSKPGEDDGSTSSIMEMAEERLASEITKGGGLGLSRFITKQVGSPSPPATDHGV